jgi:hypothetical protein
VLDVVAREDGSVAARSLVSSDDGAVHLLRNGDLDWTREESLANIITEETLFIDLPIMEIKSQIPSSGTTSLLSRYLNRVTTHIKQLRDLPSALITFGRHFATGKYEEIELGSIYRDAFGFRKFIVVASRTGKLFALDAADKGSIIWSAYLGQDVSFKGMWILRESNVVRDKRPLVGVLLSRAGTCQFLQVAALDGAIVEVGDCEVDLERMNKVFQVPMGILDDEGRRPIVVVSETGKATILPVSSTVNKIFERLHDKVYYTIQDSNGLQGYNLNGEVCTLSSMLIRTV